MECPSVYWRGQPSIAACPRGCDGGIPSQDSTTTRVKHYKKVPSFIFYIFKTLFKSADLSAVLTGIHNAELHFVTDLVFVFRQSKGCHYTE